MVLYDNFLIELKIALKILQGNSDRVQNTPIVMGVSEWLLFISNSAIVQLYHGENKLIFDEMMMRSAFYLTNTLSWIFIVPAWCNTSPQVDMSLHSGTLFWFRANQSLLFLLNVACLIFFIFYTVNVDLFHISSIWVQLKSHLWRWSEVEQPEVTWPEVTSVTWPEMTGSCVTGRGPVRNRKNVMRMRNRTLHSIRLSETFSAEVTSVTWLEVTGTGPVRKSREWSCAHTQLVYLVVVQVAWLPLTEGNPKVWKGVRMPNWKLLNISLVGPFHHPHRHHHHRHHHHHHHHHRRRRKEVGGGIFGFNYD